MTATTCGICQLGTVPVGHCTCDYPQDCNGSTAPHQEWCGWEPCPNGCWDLLFAEESA